MMSSELRRYRREQGLSAQQLSDACARLGLEISRSTLADLENGRRTTLTVAELLILAAALEVPPLLLALPLGRQEDLEILPALQMNTWDSARWWQGEAVIKGSGNASELSSDPDVDVLLLAHAHADLLRMLSLLENMIMQLAALTHNDPAEAKAAAIDPTDIRTLANAPLSLVIGAPLIQSINGNYEQIAESLGEIRNTMREQGLIPPPLPPKLAHLDKTDGAADHKPA